LLIGISHVVLQQYNTLVAKAQLEDMAKPPEARNHYAITRDLETMLDQSLEISELFNTFFAQQNLPMLANKFIEEYHVDLGNTKAGTSLATAFANYKKNQDRGLSITEQVK